MSTTVAERLAALGAQRGDTPAVIGDRRVLSWRELAAEVAEIASGLGEAVSVPDAPVVAVEATNTPGALVQIFGVLVAQLPVLPLDPRAPAGERERLLRLVASEHGPVHLLSDSGVEVTATSDEPARQRPPVACLLVTGGSSGRNKVVAAPGPLRYEPLRTPSPLFRRTGWRTGQRQLIVGPLHHTAPFAACLDGILDANTVVLLPAFAPDLALDLIRAESIEWLQLTPAHMRSIVQLTDPTPADFASIAAVLHTAAACDFATKKEWLGLVGPERVWESYGSTEAVGVTLARGDEWLDRPGTVGKGFLTQIRVLDEAGRRLPPGEVGTVYMRRGRMAMRASYLGRLAMPTTPDGFASVGDHGWLDADGYLFLTPRRTDLINVGGENVYPAEVEATILEHPSVLDAVVVGGPDPILGAVVHARVVVKAGTRIGKADLIRHCAARLSPYKVPRQFSFVSEVPRTAAGKLERWRTRAGR